MNLVFVGPTISHKEVQQYLDCICMPPVCHGDLLGLIDQQPAAIGIIDSYFEGAPSVWHKEILYAMNQGVNVYGSSSMGALRAAELHTFGMRGVGKIFEWYRDLVIEDDDEVAVLHGPAEVGYTVASEPMISIRATLGLALEHGVIDHAIHDELIVGAKNTFYKRRSWRSVREHASALINKSALAQLESWLEQNRIDLKKDDAIAMLKTMASEQEELKQPFEPKFNFEWTNVWDTAYQTMAPKASSGRGLGVNDQIVLNQLRLDPEKYQRYRDKALLAWVCGRRTNTNVETDQVQFELQKFRETNRLDTRPQLLDYMSQTDLDEERLTGSLREAALVRQTFQAAGDLRVGIISQLKLSGIYLDMLDTANRKQSALDRAGLIPDQSGLIRPQLLAWYYRQRIGKPIPDDITESLAQIDLEHSDDFYRLIAEDYLYWQLSQ
ncbi:MAG: TfuA-like protein [Arenicellales bacterium]